MKDIIQFAGSVLYGDKVWPKFKAKILAEGEPEETVPAALRFAMGAVEEAARRQGMQLDPAQLGAVFRSVAEQVTAMMQQAGREIDGPRMQQIIHATVARYIKQKSRQGGGPQQGPQPPQQGPQPPQQGPQPQGLIGGAM